MTRLRLSQHGAATVELAVVFPAFLVLLFTGVQAAEWYQARNLCLAAARNGVQVARTTTGTLGDGRAAAEAFLAHAGGSAVSDTQISSGGSTPTLVRIQVSGAAPRVLPIPGLRLLVSEASQAGKERVTAGAG